MRAVVLDTDAASLIIKKRLPPTLSTRLIGTQPLITFVTRAELMKWAEVRKWGTANRRMLDAWLAAMPMLPGDEDVADAFGLLAAAAMRRGRPRPTNDSWIAACCLTHELPLATLNVKDFEDFRAYHRLEILTR
ncbi:type II toxin-antitoxin system VapC family toxin [Actinoplanes sp. Pm04-4]|uniref:Type II toxin-antitoxin system VapC family toxin n=1 Tax=Paractinoplanes pyxinae TaxID=2997416 RepID=A0ABT4B3D5_9ACTN|nr:type II toxin-antitoxin system VapC family toxin [Actinoplanes pyxinae]MCY1140113.1 type II toxin-antitoxin system VapC family toxin [Actinoplanes pyxinae]